MTSKKHFPSSSKPRVALIVETSQAPGRDTMCGIAQYIQDIHKQGSWSIHWEPRAIEETAPSWLAKWDGDGIIARIHNKIIASAVLKTGLPSVDVLGLVPEAGVPLVRVDDDAIARLAADHLLEIGFRSFGFCGIMGALCSKARRDTFEQIVTEAGHECNAFQLPLDTQGKYTREALEKKVMAWVISLPKPVGIMVCNDSLGQLVLEACCSANISVPEEASVIGVGNDKPICEISDPPLSSVIPNQHRVGYEAAALLDRLMSGAEPPNEPIYTKPVGIQTRLSTISMALDDREVSAAVHFICKHACDGIEIDDVVQQVALSRSVLQRRFRKILSRSIHDEILRVRLQHVKTLLVQSNLPIETVAAKTGFPYRQYLGQVFKAATGLTLREYRQKYRMNDSHHKRPPALPGRL